MKTLSYLTALLIAFTATTNGKKKDDNTPKAWKRQCVACHGKDGKGNTPTGKALSIRNLTSKEFSEIKTRESIKTQIRNGSSDENGLIRMIAYKDILKEEEVDALVEFIINLPQGEE